MLVPATRGNMRFGFFNQGGLMEHAMVKQSMTLFAREVLPHCK